MAGRRHVAILGLEPVGQYAVRILFDDLHTSGIYSWQYLYELGLHKFARIRAYLVGLKKAGLSRDAKVNTVRRTKRPSVKG